MARLFKLLVNFISVGKFVKYILLGILSGLFSFLFVNLVTRTIALIISGRLAGVQIEYVLLFASVILLFIWLRRTLSLAITGLSQKVFWDLRKEILSFVLKANYQQLSARRSGVQTAVLNDVSVLMDASLSVITFSTSSILAVSCLIYLLTISLTLFVVTLVTALLGVTVYHLSSGENMRQFQQSRRLENAFQQNFVSILDGFKEIYMEPRKGKYICDEKIGRIAAESYRNNMSAFTGFINNQITGQILFYILISSVLLFFSLSLKIPTGDVVSFVFTLLYLLGSIETIMVLLPVIMRAKVASNHLMGLKKELEEANFDNPVPEKNMSRDEFEQIIVRDLVFRYGDDEKSFGIGPVSLDIQKGDVIFIYGGNGSGKTTFVHAVLGLCLPSSGEISLNGTTVKNENYPYYRTLFSVVFSDFHLFEEIMIAEDIDREKWDHYLRLFELEDKVKLEGKTLSTTDLSTGQRKRLALIAALLEEKPILVIDEWAADQDPYFRRKFYTEIIPSLKDKGTSILAITHDDRYYYCADKLYKMDYGRLVQEEPLVYAQPSIA